MNPAIEVHGLHVKRGDHQALDGVTIQIEVGTVTGLIGPSGSGKTTFIRTLAGVQAHVRGTVQVLGSTAGSSSNRRRVGYLTQGGSIYPDLTAIQNVQHFARLSGVPHEAATTVLSRVNLADRGSQLVSTMSGGQRARVGLASVLVTDADLLLLDEPTVGLDPLLRQDLWALFRELAAEGTTLLVSSHVMDEAARCDRVLLLREGQLLADGTPEELRTKAQSSDLDEAFTRLAQQSES